VAGGHATGVEYHKNGAAAFVAAAREVVVSAGPYKSAQLLQLSGIGPADLLKRIGVPLVKDLPVGRGTTGRPITFQVYSYSGVPLARENDRAIVTSQAAKTQFLAGKGGVLGVGFASANGVLANANAIISHTESQPPPDDNSKEFLSGCFINPQSKGSVEIASASAAVAPVVTTNFLAADGDASNAAACLRRQHEVMTKMPAKFGLGLQYPPDGTVSTDTVRRTTENGCA
jgi:choline dehydrogenase